jgi:hypothetical protein
VAPGSVSPFSVLTTPEIVEVVTWANPEKPIANVSNKLRIVFFILFLFKNLFDNIVYEKKVGFTMNSNFFLIFRTQINKIYKSKRWVFWVTICQEKINLGFRVDQPKKV